MLMKRLELTIGLGEAAPTVGTGVWTFRGRIAGRCAKGPGRQARSRAQGSIGVPPVFPIGVQDDDQELAVRICRRDSPICSRHSATQARRLCYLRLGVMQPLKPVMGVFLPLLKCPNSRPRLLSLG